MIGTIDESFISRHCTFGYVRYVPAALETSFLWSGNSAIYAGRLLRSCDRAKMYFGAMFDAAAAQASSAVVISPEALSDGSPEMFKTTYVTAIDRARYVPLHMQRPRDPNQSPGVLILLTVLSSVNPPGDA
jgi:hypothetical protein